MPAVTLQKATRQGLAIRSLAGDIRTTFLYNPQPIQQLLEDELELVLSSLKRGVDRTCPRTVTMTQIGYGLIGVRGAAFVARRLGENEVGQVANSTARPGYGPLCYEIAFYFAQKEDKQFGLCPDRTLSRYSSKIWRKFHARKDISKYSSVGWTRRRCPYKKKLFRSKKVVRPTKMIQRHEDLLQMARGFDKQIERFGCDPHFEVLLKRIFSNTEDDFYSV